MDKKINRGARYAAVFITLAAVLAGLMFLSVNTGSVKVSVGELLRILTGSGKGLTNYNVIWKIRLPRVLMSALLGGALALSGFLLQTFFSNPIAGPFVLGISSGAKMLVALAMIYCLQLFGSVSSGVLIGAAFIGAMMSTGFILLVSGRLKNMAALLVAGIMIGYICSAVTDFVVTFAEDSDIVNLHNWSKGSFSGMNWTNIQTAALTVLVCLALAFLLSKPIGAYQLGEAYAQSMGVNVKLFRIALILLSSILSACVTAFAGPISFVGIAVPFLVKNALNTSKPIVVVPAVFLGGALFCTGCDLIARTVFAPTELNISTVTSVFGAPIVIYMMLRRKRG